MTMHLESRNREAFELVTDALERLDKYRETRDMAVLKSAKEKLVSAKGKDPLYFRAHYFDAIVDDLTGNSKNAVDTFSRLLEEQPPFAEEVRYNLGVAWYHQYNHEALDHAIGYLAASANSTNEPLRLLARAGLAQAHAMHIIPKLPDQFNAVQGQQHFDTAMTEASDAIRAASKMQRTWPFRTDPLTKVAAEDIAWAAHNARGMAIMYRSDYVPAATEESSWREKRIQDLQEALQELEQAERTKARTWENYCDMASAKMRLAYYRNDSALFSEALTLLDTVVKRLRPGYGFALYEMGRVYRLSGEFDNAVSHFERALAIPVADRDVGDRRLNIERDRAKRHDKTFP
jgi:tetratricopeptide (TPR) repeat protein